jgi:hemerythrin
MTIKAKDDMIRIAPEIYAIIRLASVQYKKDVREIANEGMTEWIKNHVSREDKKLFEEMISRRNK